MATKQQTRSTVNNNTNGGKKGNSKQEEPKGNGKPASASKRKDRKNSPTGNPVPHYVEVTIEQRSNLNYSRN